MDNPALWERLLRAAADNQPALRRRIAIVDVLWERGLSERADLVRAVEQRLGVGAFGASPASCLWSDMRALRDAGIAIGYSRRKGAAGYFLRTDALPAPLAAAVRSAARDLDWDLLDRLAKASAPRRVAAVFEMNAWSREVAGARRPR